ncbi:MAG: ABC transporter ATP-binding protein [Actinomycetota bacterium]|nr:ABC transporter ATP-binding protein [Actinomycetota bacterium]
MSAIELRGLVKRFGAYTAVDDLNLAVPQGSVFGFLGPNGAGKTTTIRVLTGLARPTAGEALIFGVDVARDFKSVSSRLGYLPENPAFYGWMTAREYLEFCADLFELEGDRRAARLSKMLEFCGLAGVDRPISGFSRGMKQRLGLAQALINDADILFLDEPTSALDPMGRKEVLDMIASLAHEKTVFLSTHILEDVERVCDRVAMLREGKLVLESDLETLKSRYLEPVFTLEFDGPIDMFITLLSGLVWVVDVRTEGRTVIVRTNNLQTAERELPKLVARASLPLRHYQMGEMSLEEIFMKVLA